MRRVESEVIFFRHPRQLQFYKNEIFVERNTTSGHTERVFILKKRQKRPLPLELKIEKVWKLELAEFGILQ